MVLIKRWEIKDEDNERGFSKCAIVIEHQLNKKTNERYYEIWGSGSSNEITEAFAKKLIPIMDENLHRGKGEVWLDTNGVLRTGGTDNYILKHELSGEALKNGMEITL